jgi:hypothetical protein
MKTVHTGSFYKGDAARGGLKRCNRPIDGLKRPVTQTFHDAAHQESLSLHVTTRRGNVVHDAVFHSSANSFFLDDNDDCVAGLHENPFELGDRMLRKATKQCLMTGIQRLDGQRQLTELRNLTDIAYGKSSCKILSVIELEESANLIEEGNLRPIGLTVRVP